MAWRSAFLFALVAMAATAVSAGSSDLDPGSTGAPLAVGEGAEPTCTACHADAALNPDADARIELRGLPDPYVPGVRYPLTLDVTHADPGRLRWGFALTPVAPKRPGDAGRLIATDRQNTRATVKKEPTTRRYLTHTYPGTAIGRTGGQRWIFDWVAPLSDVGVIEFFASVVAADADGTEHGDLVYSPAPGALAVVRSPAVVRAEREAEAEGEAETEPAAPEAP